MTTGRLRISNCRRNAFCCCGLLWFENATFVDVEGFGPDQIYERGEYEVDRGRFADAAFFFSGRTPLPLFGCTARHEMQAYAHHETARMMKPRSRKGSLIFTLPKRTAYAQFLIGLSYYDQIADVGRDQKIPSGITSVSHCYRTIS